MALDIPEVTPEGIVRGVARIQCLDREQKGKLPQHNELDRKRHYN